MFKQLIAEADAEERRNAEALRHNLSAADNDSRIAYNNEAFLRLVGYVGGLLEKSGVQPTSQNCFHG